MRAAGPTDSNRKHHPKAAPREPAYAAPGSSGVQPTPENGVRLRLWPSWTRTVSDSRLKEIRRLSLLGDSTSLYHTNWEWLDFSNEPVHGTQAALSAIRYPSGLQRRRAEMSR